MSDFQTGDKVIYTGTQGYPVDHDKAALAGIEVGREYTVQAAREGSFYTDLRLLGMPGWHNSVIFELVRPFEGEAPYVPEPPALDTDTYYATAADPCTEITTTSDPLNGDAQDADVIVNDGDINSQTITINIAIENLVINLG